MGLNTRVSFMNQLLDKNLYADMILQLILLSFENSSPGSTKGSTSRLSDHSNEISD